MNKEEKDKKVKELLARLVDLRRKCALSNDKSTRREFELVQAECAKELDYLVEGRARRYRGFSNYDDLCQDGRLALYLALQSYEPEKGDFYWWANKYIKTKISREANRHSTIKIPLKHTKTVLPYKVSQLPVIVDGNPSACESMEKDQTSSIVRSAVGKLPEDQRRVVELHYEMAGHGHRKEEYSIGKICDKLNITRLSCVRLLNKAQEALRQDLLELEI